MLLAERLRMLRAKHDWTLDELAQRAQVGRVTIHRAERGSERITAPVIMRLARTFDVTTDYLLGMDAFQEDAAPAPTVSTPSTDAATPSR